jgi:hypothetical protein
MADLFHRISWHTEAMAASALSDLDGLDVEALKAMVVEQHAQLNENK